MILTQLWAKNLISDQCSSIDTAKSVRVKKTVVMNVIQNGSNGVSEFIAFIYIFKTYNMARTNLGDGVPSANVASPPNKKKRTKKKSPEGNFIPVHTALTNKMKPERTQKIIFCA